MIQTDVCIVGAGPGGAATALRLAQLNIPCVLIDKATFPRDKVCGDGLTGRTVAILNRINPEIINTLGAKPYAADSWGVLFKMDDKRAFPVPFRKDFIKGTDKAPCLYRRDWILIITSLVLCAKKKVSRSSKASELRITVSKTGLGQFPTKQKTP